MIQSHAYQSSLLLAPEHALELQGHRYSLLCVRTNRQPVDYVTLLCLLPHSVTSSILMACGSNLLCLNSTRFWWRWPSIWTPRCLIWYLMKTQRRRSARDGGKRFLGKLACVGEPIWPSWARFHQLV